MKNFKQMSIIYQRGSIINIPIDLCDQALFRLEITRNLSCSFCSYIASKKILLIRHIYSHSGELMKCKYCDKSINPFDYDKHLYREHK